jgi:hypothetical protein
VGWGRVLVACVRLSTGHMVFGLEGGMDGIGLRYQWQVLLSCEGLLEDSIAMITIADKSYVMYNELSLNSSSYLLHQFRSWSIGIYGSGS